MTVRQYRLLNSEEARSPGTPHGPRLQVAPRVGRHVALKVIQPEDYPTLRRAEDDPMLLQRWRFRGVTPSPEHWAQSLWNGVFAQFLVVRRADNAAAGIVMAYGASFQNDYAYVGALKLDSEDTSPVVALGCFLFFEYLFWTWPLRKLYFEVPEFNMTQFGNATNRLLREEGRLIEHSYAGGRYWDELVLALYRQDWQRERRRLLAIEGVEDWIAGPADDE